MKEINLQSICQTCKKSFLIIKQEADFYARQNISHPQNCMECRRKQREGLRNPHQLFSRTCDKCHTELTSTYAPDSPYIVYCEKCYLGEM